MAGSMGTREITLVQDFKKKLNEVRPTGENFRKGVSAYQLIRTLKETLGKYLSDLDDAGQDDLLARELMALLPLNLEPLKAAQEKLDDLTLEIPQLITKERLPSQEEFSQIIRNKNLEREDISGLSILEEGHEQYNQPLADALLWQVALSLTGAELPDKVPFDKFFKSSLRAIRFQAEVIGGVLPLLQATDKKSREKNYQDLKNQTCIAFKALVFRVCSTRGPVNLSEIINFKQIASKTDRSEKAWDRNLCIGLAQLNLLSRVFGKKYEKVLQEIIDQALRETEEERGLSFSIINDFKQGVSDPISALGGHLIGETEVSNMSQILESRKRYYEDSYRSLQNPGLTSSSEDETQITALHFQLEEARKELARQEALLQPAYAAFWDKIKSIDDRAASEEPRSSSLDFVAFLKTMVKSEVETVAVGDGSVISYDRHEVHLPRYQWIEHQVQRRRGEIEEEIIPRQRKGPDLAGIEIADSAYGVAADSLKTKLMMPALSFVNTFPYTRSRPDLLLRSSLLEEQDLQEQDLQDRSVAVTPVAAAQPEIDPETLPERVNPLSTPEKKKVSFRENLTDTFVLPPHSGRTKEFVQEISLSSHDDALQQTHGIPNGVIADSLGSQYVRYPRTRGVDKSLGAPEKVIYETYNPRKFFESKLKEIKSEKAKLKQDNELTIKAQKLNEAIQKLNAFREALERYLSKRDFDDNGSVKKLAGWSCWESIKINTGLFSKEKAKMNAAQARQIKALVDEFLKNVSGKRQPNTTALTDWAAVETQLEECMGQVTKSGRLRDLYKSLQKDLKQEERKSGKNAFVILTEEIRSLEAKPAPKSAMKKRGFAEAGSTARSTSSATPVGGETGGVLPVGDVGAELVSALV